MFAKGVELGQFPADGNEMLTATIQLASAYQSYGNMQFYHQVFRSQAWDILTHESLFIDTKQSPIAATGVFLPTEAESTYLGDPTHLLVFNIFPQEDSLYVQFTWRPEIDAVMRSAIAPILRASGEFQLYLLSKFILKYTETFVLKPSTYDAFTDRQVGAIQSYFAANSGGDRQEWDDRRLFLFGRVD